MQISTLAGDSLQIFGEINLNFSLANAFFSWPFQISEIPESMFIDGILGWDFLKTFPDVFSKCMDLSTWSSHDAFPVHSNVSTLNESQSSTQDSFQCNIDEGACLAPLPTEEHIVLPSDIHPDFVGLVRSHHELFTKKIKVSKLGQFNIELSSSKPVKTPPRRVPLHFIKKVTEMLNDYEAQGIIRRSQSPFYSPVVLVPKKTGDIRFACDYRRLNAVTIKDSSPIPTFEEIRDSLQGCTIFSKFDLRSGYWQLPLSAMAIEKTAFSPGPQFGLWEWTVLPFGLSNAVSHFHREMTKAFADLSFVKIYLDDLFVGSSNVEQHRNHLARFFERCAKFNLTLSGGKCFIGCEKIEILGRVISKHGVSMSDEKLETIRKWPLPCTKRQLLSFLGLCNYDARFVSNYAKYTSPLYQMTRQNEKLCWTEYTVDCFNKLKQSFTTDVCLLVPNDTDPFHVQTDASDVAVSGVLLQNGRPVEFFSRKLKPSEVRYSAIQRECLAIVCTLRKFRHYLLGSCFHLQTDHKPLIWLKQQKQNGMLGRWSLELQEFDFNISHIRGCDNILADSVSRQFVNAIHVKPHFSDKAILQFQEADPIFVSIRRSVESGHTTPKLPDDTSLSLVKRWNQLYNQIVIQNGILYRRYKLRPEDEPSLIRLIPQDLQQDIIRMNHDPPHCGHLGVERTLHRILPIAYWPGIRRSVHDYISTCDSCQVVKAKPIHPPIQNFVNAATAPGELVTADILKLPNDQGYNCILLLVDAFSKFPVAYKMRNESSQAIVKNLVSYMTLFGVPRRILTDQGPNLESHLVYDALNYFGVSKGRTAIYHPQTDGQTERMNRSILEMLRHYARNGKWVDNLDLVLMAYRSSVSSVTGKSPSLLFFGREIPQAPIFQCDIRSFPSKSEWMEILDDVDLAKGIKRCPDTEETSRKFLIGDPVLIRSFVKPHKLASQFVPGWTVSAVYNGCAEVTNGRQKKTINFCDMIPLKK